MTNRRCIVDLAKAIGPVKSVRETKEDGLLADNIAVGRFTLASPHGRITHGPVLHGSYPAGGSTEVRPSLLA